MHSATVAASSSLFGALAVWRACEEVLVMLRLGRRLSAGQPLVLQLVWALGTGRPSSMGSEDEGGLKELSTSS